MNNNSLHSASDTKPRKSHSIQYKLKCVAYYRQHADTINQSQAARQLNIHKSMLSRWLRQESQLQELYQRQHLTSQDGHYRCRLRRPTVNGRGAYPAQERLLLQWIHAQRDQFQPVTYSDIQLKMREYTNHECKASAHWLYNFMRRFQLSRRKMTTSASHLSADQIQQKLRDFHVYLNEMSDQCHGAVWNVDQTPVWLNAQHYDHTVDSRGVKCVPIRRNPLNANHREKVTVILACSSSGQKLRRP